MRNCLLVFKRKGKFDQLFTREWSNTNSKSRPSKAESPETSRGLS
ncbi:MAG: hypothetical protein CM15mP49_03130 [Actinomycetota bacterium]|nr:MAG: hypothetical protein CM15mP49_03130 [Actinomycetota bacterium]